MTHRFFIQRSHFLAQPPLIQRADLLGQNDGILGQAVIGGAERDMRRHFGLVDLRCNGGGNHGRAIPVAHIVLYDQHRADTALLTADHRAEIGIVNISPFDAGIHVGSHSDEIDLRFVRKPIFPALRKNITVVC